MEEKEHSMEQLQLELDIFEGPLDLLLHLINRFEIDIYDIPIAKITDQYIKYLEQMKAEQINIASEYFVMAATLMRIKSEMLVPRNENQAEMAEDFYEEEDPREPLIELLLEYKQIKEVIPKFEERHGDRADYFGKDPTDISKHRETIELKNQGLNVSDLSTIFSEVLKRHQLQTPQATQIETEEVTVVEKMANIRARILENGRTQISFTELVSQPNRKEIVVTFLALLELIKDNRVLVEQENIQADISISITDEEE